MNNDKRRYARDERGGRRERGKERRKGKRKGRGEGGEVRQRSQR